nr:MAG TPA: hypothetical protein [Caudoviricetes sp.]
MPRVNMGKSFIVSTDDIQGGGLDTAAVQALIDKAIVNLATKTELSTKANATDVYTKTEADAKFQPKA